MWNLQPCNKLIQERIQQKNYQLHREKLRSMQPRLNIEKPSQPEFVYENKKLNLSRKQKRIEIDRLNKILLTKMQAIQDAEYSTNKLRHEAAHSRTLNGFVMEEMNNKIMKENRRFCEKLMKTQSFYKANQIMEQTDHLEYVGYQISENARRCKSAKNLSSRKRLKSAYSTAEHTGRKHTENIRPSSTQINRRLYSARPGTAPTIIRPRPN